MRIALFGESNPLGACRSWPVQEIRLPRSKDSACPRPPFAQIAEQLITEELIGRRGPTISRPSVSALPELAAAASSSGGFRVADT
jgi:hypothetical protein